MYRGFINMMMGRNTAFEMTIDTTKAGSASDTFILGAGNIGTYNATIDWGDGTTSTITTYNDADLTHVYSVGGVYQVKISGDFNWIKNGGDRLKVISIDNWGTIQWLSLEAAFSSCSNMDILATDIPNVSMVTAFNSIFAACTSITNIDLQGWDFSNATNMQLMFQLSNASVINVTGLNTSNNTSLNQTFSLSELETVVGLDTFNIESVTSFSNMFFGTKLSTVEYDKVLISWDGQDAVNSLAVNFGTSKYTLGSAAATARAGLIANDLWTITDGGGI